MSDAEAWEDDIVRGLRSLTTDESANLEIVVIDAVADWLFSAGNPGDGYDEGHAGHLISTLFTALDTARSFRPEQEPPVTDEIAHARTRVVDGAHELATADGVSLIVSRLMPALMAELQTNAGDRAKQAHGVFVYLLYALAIGTREEQDPTVMDGLTAAFAGWDTVLRGGYVPPWRPRPSSEGPDQLRP